MFRSFLLLLTLVSLATQAQPTIPPVIDWRAPTTLPTYLLQQVHQQYEPRRAELARALGSAAGTQAYRDSARARFRRVLGPLPARTPLRARVVGTVPQAGFRIEKVIYESTPHHHVTANLYLPEEKGKKPTVLLFCGHENISKATPSYQQTARLFARNGFVVLVIDPVSQGERLQLTDASGKPLTRGGTTEHTLLNAQAALLGRTLPAEELWDNVRGLDYLLTRPEVDAARVGCLGNSGGATQTAYFLGYDDRVRVAALCSYVASGERNLTLTGPADGCVQLPGAGAVGLDIADWPIMFAPKPLLWLTGRYDFVDQTDMEAAYAETHRAYAALGQPDHTGMFTYDDGHGISAPKRVAAVAWFRQWLGGGGTPVPEETPLVALPEATLRCTATGQVATSFKDEETLAASHLAAAQAFAAHRPTYSPDALIAVVQRQLNQGLPTSTAPVTTGIDLRDTLRLPNGQVWRNILLRCTNQPPLPARLLLPTGPAAPTRLVLWLPDQGMATVLRDSAARLTTYQRQGTAVLLADLRGLGETTDPAAFNDPKYYNQEYRDTQLALHLGRPLLAQRVTDVSTLLTLIRNDSRLWKLPILLRADGRAALVALHAALLNPGAAKKPYTMTNDAARPGTAPGWVPQLEQVQVSGGPPSFRYFLENPAAKDAYSEVLPGVLRQYDVPDLRRALGTRLVP